MIALLFVLAQWVSSPDHGNPNHILSGTWQSCREADGFYAERIYDGPTWEFHMGPGDEFALFKGIQDTHRDHASKANLLGPAYHVSDVVTWRGKRNWNIPALKLWINVVQAGGGRSDCESFWVLVEHGVEQKGVVTHALFPVTPPDRSLGANGETLADRHYTAPVGVRWDLFLDNRRHAARPCKDAMIQTDTQVTFSRDEIVQEIERVAQRTAGLTAREFVRAWRAHRIFDRSAVVDVAMLVNLLRDDDPLLDPR